MAHREFRDGSGRAWTVWDVYPSLVERRRRSLGPPPGMLERRHRVRPRVIIASDLAEGWLAFESSDGEHRRLAPVPSGWAGASEDRLGAWCTMAKRSPRSRRLIE